MRRLVLLNGVLTCPEWIVNENAQYYANVVGFGQTSGELRFLFSFNMYSREQNRKSYHNENHKAMEKSVFYIDKEGQLRVDIAGYRKVIVDGVFRTVFNRLLFFKKYYK